MHKMATLDGSPSLFPEQSWTLWATKIEDDRKGEAVPVTVVDGCVNKAKDDSDTMKLRKKDMSLYGLCPARDEFYLVVCESCGQLIKPQAFKTHIEQRHSSLCAAWPTEIEPPTMMATSLLDASELVKSSRSSVAKRPDHLPLSNRSTSPPAVADVHESPAGTQPWSDRLSPSQSDRLSPSLQSLSPTQASCQSQPDRHAVSPVLSSVPASSQPPTTMTSPKKSKPVASTPALGQWLPVTEAVRPGTHHKLCPRNQHSQPVVKVERMHTPPATTSASKRTSLASVISTTSPIAALSRSAPSHQEPMAKDRSKIESAVMTGGKRPPTACVRKSVQWPVTMVKVEKPAVTVSMTSPSVSVATTTCMSSTTTVTTMTTAMTSSSSGVPSPRNKKPIRERKFLPCKDREFDPERHCGVWIAELSRQCTRSLTCKTHALSLRRAVAARSKTFDDLLLEHRAAKEAIQKAKVASGQLPASTSPVNTPVRPIGAQLGGDAGGGGMTESDAGQAKPKSSHHSSRTSASTSKSSASSPHSTKTKCRAPVTSESASRLSSEGEEDDAEDGGDDDDEDGIEGKYDHPYLSFHPRPAAVNRFGSWLHGRGCYVFNRREDLSRAAFSAAVHRHLHPPSHKRLCVESKLPEGSDVTTNAKDPYEFGGDNSSSTPGNVKSCTNLHPAKLTTAAKSRPKVALSSSASAIHVVDGTWSTAAPTANRTVNVPVTGRTVSAKRKRVSSDCVPATVCLAPASVNLTTAPRLTGLNNGTTTLLAATHLNDMNIVLQDGSTSIGGTGLLNGQLVSIPAMQLGHRHQQKAIGKAGTADTLSAIMTALPVVGTGGNAGTTVQLVAGSTAVGTLACASPDTANSTATALFKPSSRVLTMAGQQNGMITGSMTAGGGVTNAVLQPTLQRTQHRQTIGKQASSKPATAASIHAQLSLGMAMPCAHMTLSTSNMQSIQPADLLNCERFAPVQPVSFAIVAPPSGGSANQALLRPTDVIATATAERTAMMRGRSPSNNILS